MSDSEASNTTSHQVLESDEDIVFESISLNFQDSLLFDSGLDLSSHFTSQTFKQIHSHSGQEILSPRLWDLPDVFRKKLISYSTLYLADVQRLNRMSDSIRYNFSNGTQISCQEILRHRFQRKVPLDYLPNGKDQVQPFERWPLLQEDKIGRAHV